MLNCLTMTATVDAQVHSDDDRLRPYQRVLQPLANEQRLRVQLEMIEKKIRGGREMNASTSKAASIDA